MKRRKNDVWKSTEIIYQSKKKVNEQIERKINEDVNGNRKLFWKEVSSAKGGKVESCSRTKTGNRRLTQGEDEVRNIWKEYFKDLYNRYSGTGCSPHV